MCIKQQTRNHDKELQEKSAQEIRKDTVQKLLSPGGPLYEYLHPEGTGCTFSRLKELINEALDLDFSYSELYNQHCAKWLFNASLDWSQADQLESQDVNTQNQRNEK